MTTITWKYEPVYTWALKIGIGASFCDAVHAIVESAFSRNSFGGLPDLVFPNPGSFLPFLPHHSSQGLTVSRVRYTIIDDGSVASAVKSSHSVKFPRKFGEVSPKHLH
jgi:hypothetical protein